jgi:hypothetical protein
MSEHPYRDAGRRLKAAIISYRFGRADVDRTLKEIPDDPGEGWAELAERLDRGMAEQIGKLIFNPSEFGFAAVQ